MAPVRVTRRKIAPVVIWAASSQARSRSITSSSGSRSSAVFLFAAAPWTRAMPSMTVSTRGSEMAGTCPAWRWARAIAAARRRIVETARPRRASEVRYRAITAAEVGRLSSW